MVSVLVNAVEEGGCADTQEHEHTPRGGNMEKNVNGLKGTHAPITADVLSFKYWEIHSPRSFPTFVVC